MRAEKFDIIFHVDNGFTFLIRIVNIFRPIALDIRSGDLSDNKMKLWIKNRQITFAALFYKNVSVISESLRDTLNLNKNRTTIIPLGGEKQPTAPKDFQSVRLLYVGSINNRNIHETVLGLSVYLKKGNAFWDISYDIVGFGKPGVIDQLNRTIISEGLTDKVIISWQEKNR